MNILPLLKKPIVMLTVGLLLAIIFIPLAVPSSLFIDAGTTGYTDYRVENPNRGSIVGHTSGHIELNQETFAVGWKPDGGDVKSEAINVDYATITIDTFDQDLDWDVVWWRLDRPVCYHYEWYINNNLIQTSPDHVGGGDRIEGEDESGGVSQTDTLITDPVTYLIGETTGTLECRLVADVSSRTNSVSDPLGTTEIVENQLLAKYTATLKAGWGEVRIGGDLPDVIEEGSDARFYLKTGYTGAGNGWTCNIVSPSGDKTEYTGDGFTGQDGFDGYCDFTIPLGWFQVGGDNECTIELYNHLWQESRTTFFTIDDIEKQPTITDISWDTEFISGGAVTVTVTGEPNSITNSPLDYFRVYVYYGEPGSMPGADFPSEYIINGMDYQASDNTATFTFTLVANREGQVSLKATAIDIDGRASMGEFLSMDVVNPGGTGGGNVDSDPEYPFVWTTAAIIVLVMLILGIIAIAWFAPVPLNIKIILITIIGIAGAILVWLFGTLQLGG